MTTQSPDPAMILRELQQRLQAMGLLVHLKTKYSALYVSCFVIGLWFLLHVEGDTIFLTVGLLNGHEHGAGRVCRDYVFRGTEPETVTAHCLFGTGLGIGITARTCGLGALTVA